MFEHERNIEDLNKLWDKKLNGETFTCNEKIRFNYLNRWFDDLEARREQASFKANQPV